MQKCVQGENQEQTKLWNKTYILVLLLSTFNQSVSQMVTPFISKYAISLGALHDDSSNDLRIDVNFCSSAETSLWTV